MSENIYINSYYNMFNQERIRTQYKLIDTVENKQIFSASSNAQCYYQCQSYCRQHENVPVQLVRVNENGQDEVVETYTCRQDRNGNYHMYRKSTYDRIQSNADKYNTLIQTRTANRQRNTDLRTQINQIRNDAAKRISELQEQIRQIRSEAEQKIRDLKVAAGVTTDPNTEVTADQTDTNDTPNEPITEAKRRSKRSRR